MRVYIPEENARPGCARAGSTKSFLEIAFHSIFRILSFLLRCECFFFPSNSSVYSWFSAVLHKLYRFESRYEEDAIKTKMSINISKHGCNFVDENVCFFAKSTREYARIGHFYQRNEYLTLSFWKNYTFHARYLSIYFCKKRF